MSIYSKVVSTTLPINSVHTTVEGAIHGVGAVYTFLNGERKKLFPEENPVSDPTITYDTPGTHKVTLAPGYYKFTIRGAGGGGAAGYTNQSYSAAAGGGGAAYGTFELLLNVQETFTFVCGAGGSPHNVWGQNRAGGSGGNGGQTTLSSNLRGTFITLNGGTGGYAFTANGNDHIDPSASAGIGGTYSVNLPAGTTQSFTAPTNGTTQTRKSYAHQSVGYGGTINGGIAKAGPVPGQGSYCTSEAVAGGNGYLKIEPAVQYIYTSPITTSLTLDPGTYYFEIVGAGGGGLCATQGGSYYAYANGGSAASGYGYFTVETQGVYNIQVGTQGNGVTSIADQFSTRTVVSGNGTATYIKRAADNFNVVTCEGGTGASWWCIYHSQSAPEAGFNYGGQAGTYSTDLANNYTLANGSNGTTRNIRSSDSAVDLPYVYPTYFNTYGIGGASKRLYDGSDHGTGYSGICGMLKIYKYS